MLSKVVYVKSLLNLVHLRYKSLGDLVDLAGRYVFQDYLVVLPQEYDAKGIASRL
jgi:hypothetical protein